jgi:predicted house-cleaning noncanonical NTP pyrophosphatase (MazG superfamily)
VKQYDKLVRDRVPAMLLAGGHNPVSKTVDGEELLAALRAKADEELAEYDAAVDDDKAAEELADLIEVIVAIARERGCDEARIGKLRAAKTLERGAFGMGQFLIKAE